MISKKIMPFFIITISLICGFLSSVQGQENEIQIIQQVRAGFPLLDTNKDQKLTIEELLKPVQSPTPDLLNKVDEFFNSSDKDNDNGLSVKELDDAIAELQKKSNTDSRSSTFTNVKYGSHERNVLDLWLAKSDKPTPIVIYIHGGGFMLGDKKKGHNQKNIDLLRSKGISYASINYRFLYHTQNGVLGCMEDAKRAVQFLRYKAAEWNLDKSKFACIGGSAGAGTSLWLAFSDDMADKDNADPVLRESTRLSAAGVFATQSTYNIARWTEILNVAKEDEEVGGVLNFYGFKTLEELNSEKGKKYISDIDFLAKITKDDPPFYASNNMKGGLVKVSDKNHLYHHPLHVKALHDQAEKAGIENQCYAKAIGIKYEGKNLSLMDFIIAHLK